MLFDPSLDSSGFTPQALANLIEVAGRLSYEESAVLLSKFGLELSPVTLQRLMLPYSRACLERVTQRLTEKAFEPLADVKQAPARVMVVQTDGVVARGRPRTQASPAAKPEAELPQDWHEEKKNCPGMEIKTAIVYPQEQPSERWMLADIQQADDFLPLLSGLLREAGVRQQDVLVGLGDGASWIATNLRQLGATFITDVYHSCQYLDGVMQALGFSEGQRFYHRRAWLRGDVRARDWLKQHLPEPQVWLGWSKKAQTALQYLELRLDSMDYPDYIDKNYPIGSGQVEGMNKSVIGKRMKGSGMQWSQEGAASMASLRAQLCAKHSLTDFEALRHEAFPSPVLQS